MKDKIHPKYYPQAKITCACGNIIITGSTKPEMKVEVCSACHPFYTGKKRLVDATGRLDRFKKRVEKGEKMKAAIKERKLGKPARIATQSAAGGKKPAPVVVEGKKKPAKKAPKATTKKTAKKK
jgi:large subunit ribosomal protein L31